jgi:putative DNA primase/helicase
MSELDNLMARGNVYNDTWNAGRFYDRHGHDVFYHDGEWYWWDGAIWKRDTMSHVPDLAVKMVQELQSAADGKALLAHLRSSGNNSKIDALLKILSKRRDLNISDSEIDRHDDILTLQNGLFNLEDSTLLDPVREMFRVKRFGISYDKEAYSPTWVEFLNRVFVNHPELVGYMQRVCGYALASSMRDQCMFILYGDGMNGKSVLINTLHKIFGDYACATPAGTFIAKKHDNGIPNDVATMYRKRFVTCLETGKSKYLNEPLIKQLTGCDMVTARFLHKEFFTFIPTSKILLATNHKPTIESNDKGIWRRLKLIPLDSEIALEEVDAFRKKHGHDIEAQLTLELPGIFNWMVEGYQIWRETGLQDPIIVMEAIDEYREQQDAIGQFLCECCETTPIGSVSIGELYRAFKQYARDNGYGFFRKSEVDDYMKQRGYRKNQNWNRGSDTYGKRIYEGIKLKQNYDSHVTDEDIPF